MTDINRMTEDQLYDTRALDRLTGYDVVRRENDISRADMDWLDEFDNRQADAEINEMLKGYTDRRGSQLPGFEFVRSESTRSSTSDIDEIIAQRRRIELAADPDMTRRVLSRGVTR
jgi:hypothetical protein